MAKRFKITGSGKILHFRSMHSHYMLKKSKRRKKALRIPHTVEGSLYRHIRKGLLT